MGVMQKQRGSFGIGRGAVSAPATIRPTERMIDEVPVAVMLCDLDFTITYLNKVSRESLKKIEHALPVRAGSMHGQSVDVFHKNPGHQRRMLIDPRNLPHKARISIGGEWLDLHVTAVTDDSGNCSF